MEKKEINTLEDFERRIYMAKETRGLPNISSAQEVAIIIQKWVKKDGDVYTDDGFSLHLNEEDCVTFIKEYREENPEILQYDHSEPCGDPYYGMVSHELFARVEQSKNGLRMYDDAIFSK